MFQKICARLSSMRFRYKVILVFAAILCAILGFLSGQQIGQTNQLRFAEARDNLSLLTEQVSINVAQQLSAQSLRLYNSVSMYDLPRIIRSGKNINELRLALNQILSTTSPFDFATVYTANELRAVATSQSRIDPIILSEAEAFLENTEKRNYGISKWMRGVNDDIYLLRDIYHVSPLIHCGRIVAHLKPDAMFHLGAQSQELQYTFLFFTKDSGLLLSVGPLEKEARNQLVALQEQGALPRDKLTIQGQDYFISSSVQGEVETIGITPLSRVENSNRLVAVTIILYGVGALIMGVVILAFWMQQLTRQLDGLTVAMDSMAAGDLEQTVEVVSHDDIGQLAVHFNDMSRKMGLLLQRVVREETLKTRAQFKLLEYRYRSLQTQLSPHFIFNALETVNAMAKTDGSSELSRNILQISQYLRLITSNMNRQFITVEEELKGLQDYAEIYESAQGSHLSVSFACQEAARQAILPVMILQPILENALIHGIRSASEVSSVAVTAELNQSGKLRIGVRDNGKGIAPEQQRKLLSGSIPATPLHTGIGLRNVMERLELLYGSDAVVAIESNGRGTLVSVTLPLNYEIPLEFDDAEL